MNKKLLVIMMTVLMAMSSTGCKNDDTKSNDNNNSNKTADSSSTVEKGTNEKSDDEDNDKVEDSKTDGTDETATERKIITLGKYDDGEPMEWYVMDEDADGSTLLLSVNLLSKDMSYNDEDGETTWENCSLREWLNNDYLNVTFSDEEKAVIVKKTIINPANSIRGTEGGNDTEDYIFLLSLDEVNKYFSDNDSRLASKKGWKSSGVWTLRTPGINQKNVVRVWGNGSVLDTGTKVSYKMGVRPAMYVKTESIKQ